MKLLKKLVRIKLINWHLFTNQTIKIDGNSLLSGENGSGKSTFLDAIQYVLTGGKAKFNTAANNFAKRDLEGYIRCKLGTENKTFLRDKGITSHIALEFYDDINLSSKILGCVLEINQTGRIYEHFYVIYNQSIEDSFFIDKNYIKGYAFFKKQLLIKNIEVTFCESKEQTRKLFLNVLEIINDKYIELIPKALAFRPINDLNKFVFDFLLNEKNVSIDDLRQNVKSYQEFETLVNTLIEKENTLVEIETEYNNIQANFKELNDYNNLYDYIQYKILTDNERLFLDKTTKIETKIRDIKQKEFITEENIFKLTQENELLISNANYQTYQMFELKFQEQNQEYQRLKTNVKDIKAIIENERNLALYAMHNIKEEKLLALLIERLNINSFINAEDVISLCKNVKEKYEQIKEELLAKINNFKIDLNCIEEDIHNNTEIITRLKKKQFSYDYSVESLKKLLEQELPYVNVNVFCELVEVSDEFWRNALEGYLNTQRFDLIVPKENFNQALKIYEKYKIKDKLSGVGLVNTKEIVKYKDTNKISLASKLNCKNKYAQGYINMLLNNVICCDDVSELENYKTAITNTCMVYKNFTARQIKETVYKVPYLGISAIKFQLQMNEKRKIELETKLKKYTNLISNLEFNLQRVKNHQLDYIIHQVAEVNKYYVVEKEINKLKKKLSQLRLTNELSSVEENITCNKLKINELEESKKSLLVTEGRLCGELEANNKSLTMLQNEIISLKIKYKKYDESNYIKLSNEVSNDNQVLVRFVEDKIKHLDEQIKDLSYKLITYKNQFNSKYQVSYSNSLENTYHYLDELKKIREYELIKYQEKAKESRINCEIAFKEQFICKLRENILNAQEELLYLNKALNGKKFGGDEYEFIFKGSANHQFEQYYKIIMIDEFNFSKALFSDSLSDQNQIILKELFSNLIIDCNDEAKEKLLAKLCDYRNYMSYDIKIHHHSGEITYFSKVSREKSGGETQTPFYVVIAASFEQLIADKRKDLSPACFVMFDEAFNNMDESRIKAMMEFYRKLNIQLLIAVPPQRIETIIEHVNTTLVVIKTTNDSFIESFHAIEINKTLKKPPNY